MTSEYFDKMHKKIGANKLNPEEQKKLFEKFQKHGGEVIEKYKTEKTGKANQNLKMTRMPSKIQAENKDEKKKTKQKQETKHKLSFFDWLSVYLNSYSSGITTLTGNKYKRTFIKKINTNLQKNLKTLTELIDTAINSKTEEGLFTKQTIYQNSVYDYELLKLTKQIYDPNDFRIIEEKSNQNKNDVEIYMLYEPIIAIYKKIYLFKKHYINIKQKLTFAFKIYTEQNKTIKLTTVSRQIDTVIENIFNKFIFSLHYAYCKIMDMNINIQDQLLINKLLNISEKNEIDNIINKTIGQRKKEKESKIKEEKVRKGEVKEKEITQTMKKGKKWIEEITSMKEQVGNKQKHILNANDKVLSIHLILEEFEKELSFILTSNKITFNVDWSEGQKWDAKKELNDIYIKLTSYHEEIKQYIVIEENINNIKNDEAMSTGLKRERLEKLNIEKTKLSNIIRERILGLFTEIRDITHKILVSENIIQEPEKVIYFNNTIDGNKKLSNKTCAQALELCNSYVEYATYLMETGKLKGASLEFE